MYGATRRACSGSGWGRSLLMLKTALLLSAFGLLSGLPRFTEAKECDKPCMNGQCNTATGNCVCFPGWVGDQCQHCGGRFRPLGSAAGRLYEREGAAAGHHGRLSSYQFVSNNRKSRQLPTYSASQDIFGIFC